MMEPCRPANRVGSFSAPLLALFLAGCGPESPEGAAQYRAVLDLAGGSLRFALEVDPAQSSGRVCNGWSCQEFSSVEQVGDSLIMEIGDYAATIAAAPRGDSLLGVYRNVGNRGPRQIPFRAQSGTWPVSDVPDELVGNWDVSYFTPDGGVHPRVAIFEASERGLEGTWVSNTGDYGHFWGITEGDSFSMAHFDGSYVYLLTGRLEGDTLRGVFHAGARTQREWLAVRSTGEPHLREMTELTTSDTTRPFAFAFPDLQGRLVTQDDPRFAGKVLLVEVLGSWCPTCHDAAPLLVELYRDYRDQGLEIVGLAYEVSGDSAIDNQQVRRYRDKFGIEFPLLLAGINVTEATAATLPQLQGFTAYPTSIFIGRDGKVKRIHAGFLGPTLGDRHERLKRDFRSWVEELLAAPDR